MIPAQYNSTLPQSYLVMSWSIKRSVDLFHRKIYNWQHMLHSWYSDVCTFAKQVYISERNWFHLISMWYINDNWAHEFVTSFHRNCFHSIMLLFSFNFLFMDWYISALETPQSYINPSIFCHSPAVAVLPILWWNMMLLKHSIMCALWIPLTILGQLPCEMGGKSGYASWHIALHFCMRMLLGFPSPITSQIQFGDEGVFTPTMQC